MVLTYTNRKGDEYYLHQDLTEKGNPKYFFSRKKDGKLLETIPRGYETYENPNGLVFLRRAQPKVILDEEVAIVEKGMRDYADLEFYKIDVKGNAMIVFLPLQDVESLREFADLCTPESPEEITNIIHKVITFGAEMKLILTDTEERRFCLQRFCYRSPEARWITLTSSSDLQGLAKKYFKHLGKDSFFDLLPGF